MSGFAILALGLCLITVLSFYVWIVLWDVQGPVAAIIGLGDDDGDNDKNKDNDIVISVKNGT